MSELITRVDGVPVDPDEYIKAWLERGGAERVAEAIANART